MRVKNLSPTCLTLLLLTACGGSSDDSDGNTSQILTGVFIDSAVSGLNYATSTQSGVTSLEGEFQYLAGESITFSVGQLELPAVIGAPTITPLDLFNTDMLTDNRVVNLSSLLQGLDDNSNPDDGISISAAATVAAPTSTEVDFDVNRDEFVQNVAIINLVSANGTDLPGEFDAVRHLQESLVGNGDLTVISPDEWASISQGTTHMYDNGAKYYYRDDGVRLSIEPWIEGLQESTWFTADNGQFCEVSTSGPTFCFGAGENYLLTTDGDGTYLYSDPTFTSSFTVVEGNALNITSTEVGRVQVTGESINQLFDKQLFLNENFIVVRASGTFDGTWSEEPIAGTYEMIDGYFCRVLTAFHDASRLNTEDCQLWERDASTVKGTRARGTGISFVYTIVE